MQVEVVKSKIHRVKVTGADLNYIGSITIDEDLMDAANIIRGEKVQIVNNNNGERLETYANQVVNYFKARDLPTVAKTLVGDSMPNLTCNYAEAVDADLITIMSSSIDKWNVFLGSYAQQMVNKANVPLLSITPREKQIPSVFGHIGG